MNTMIRIVLQGNGAVRAYLSSKKTCICTPSVLMQILLDPRDFFENGQWAFEVSAECKEELNMAIDDIPGLTLLRVNTDNQITVIFPYLFKLLFEQVEIKSDIPFRAQNIVLDDCLPDEKTYFLALYQLLSDLDASAPKLERKLFLSQETSNEIIREIVNSYFGVVSYVNSVMPVGSNLEENEPSSSILISSEPVLKEDSIPSAFISAKEYSDVNNIPYQTVYSWCKKQKFKSALQDKKRHWWLNPNDIAVDLRAGRQASPKTATGKRYITLKNDSYEAVQKYIVERQLCTDAIRPYIRTRKEIKYYEVHNYHEVDWDGFPALIIDINPEYVCKTDGRTNRQRILDGDSPVVPRNEDAVYYIHHIGQQVDSPFAIIPSTDHINDLFTTFHQDPSRTENVHDKMFIAQKAWFWRKYLEIYDQFGSFKKIPYLNPRRKRQSRELLEEA